MTETKPSIYSRLAQAQADISKTGVGKHGKNQQQGFQYRAWDDVQQALAKCLADHGIIGPIPDVEDREHVERKTTKGAVIHHVVLRGRIRFISADDGSEVSFTAVGESMDTGDKATSKAMTMMVKYGVTHALCVPLKGLGDADAETPDEQEKQPTPMERAKELVGKVKAAETAEQVNTLWLDNADLTENTDDNVLRAQSQRGYERLRKVFLDRLAEFEGDKK